MDYQNRPTFIGIGAQKCASSWVYKVLEDHPEVGVSQPKELDFFSYYYDRGYQWYYNYFLALPVTKVIGEISPSYFCALSAPVRAAGFNAKFRIVVTLRDPIERAFSNHLHEIRIKQFSGADLTFEAGLANNAMYIEQSRYATHLQHWLDYFPREQILVLLQEDIKQDPQREAHRLYHFLEIDSNHQSGFLFRQANPSYGEKLQGIDKTLRMIGHLGRRVGGVSLVKRIRDNSWVLNMRQANRRHLSETVPSMLPETKKYLRQELADEVERLAKLLNRETLPWPTWHDLKGCLDQ